MGEWYKENQVNPNIENKASRENPWKNKSTGMICNTCVFYVMKINELNTERNIKIGRCRRNAPTMKGYPVVFPTDWCGEHRLDEEKLLCG